MSWQSLHKLYNGLIGKSIFIIGLAIPIAKLDGLGIHLQNYENYLIGAVFVSIGFFITKISVPASIVRFDDSVAYATYLLELSDRQVFDERFEFAHLYNFGKKSELIAASDCSEALDGIRIDASSETTLGQKKFVYYFSLLNFLAIGRLFPIKRLIVTFLFVFGAVALYLPVFHAISTLLAHYVN